MRNGTRRQEGRRIPGSIGEKAAGSGVEAYISGSLDTLDHAILEQTFESVKAIVLTRLRPWERARAWHPGPLREPPLVDSLGADA